MSSEGKQKETYSVQAYNQMMIRIRDLVDNAEAHAVPSLQKAIDQARRQAVHLGELTAEEAEDIGNYIKRDINDAAEYLMETSHEFSDWLRLDIEIIEKKILELFFSVADRTRIELQQLSHPSRELQRNEYHSGEITGPGTLVCRQCSNAIHFNATSRIPRCENCQGSDFVRAE